MLEEVYENKPFIALQASQQPLMVPGVLPDPGVTVIDIDCRDIARRKKNHLERKSVLK